MIVLSRKKNESIVIDNNITVTIIEIRGDKVRLGVMAPKEASVHRMEVFEAIHGLPPEPPPLTPARWAAMTDPAVMLRRLRVAGVVTERKARLFAAAALRRHWDHLSDDVRRAVEVTERAAEGEDRGTGHGGPSSIASSGPPALMVAYLLAEAGTNPADYALNVAPLAAQAGTDRAAEAAAQAGLLRCLFGPPPFRSALRPEWLAFSDGVVPTLARGIAEESAYDRLPILGDALEESGCDNAELLAHLRSPGPHARGCWAVDLVLGKS